MEQISVFIVDAHPLFRQGIRATIESQPDMTVVGEAADGQAAVNEASSAAPDLMLIDVALPVMNGLEVLRSLRNDPRTSALTTVLLTASTEASDVKDGFDLGAVDYITKPFSYFDLTRKLRPLLKLDAGVSKHARSVDAIQPPKVPVLTTPGRRSQDRWTVLFG